MAKAKMKTASPDSAAQTKNESPLARELRALLEGGQFEITAEATPELAALAQRVDHLALCIGSLNSRLASLEKTKAAEPAAPARYNPRAGK